jgi:WD40 repeat protein
MCSFCFLPGQHCSAFSPNDEFLLGTDGGSDGKLVLWHIPSGKKLGSLPEGRFRGFSPDEKLLAIATDDSLLLWDIKTGQVLARLPVNLSDRGIVFSPNGRMMAMAGPNSLKIIEVASGKMIQEFEGFRTEILDVQFAPNGRTLLTVTNNDVLIWDVTGLQGVERNR